MLNPTLKTQTSILLIISILLCSINLVGAQCLTQNRDGIHVVQSKETLYRISERYNISIENICKWNNIKMNTPLARCQELIISADFVTAVPSSFNNEFTDRGENNWQTIDQSPLQKQPGRYHIVRKGETMAGLAELYGYTEKRFREINAMSPYDEPTVGSKILNTECTCDTIASENSGNSNTSPSNSSKIISSSKPVTSTAEDNGDRSYMKTEESAMIDEINRMRANPAAYVQVVREYVAYWKESWNRTIPAKDVNNLISELQSSPPLSILKPSKCIYDVAVTHGDYLKRTKGFKHTGPNNQGPGQRTQAGCPHIKLSTTYSRIGGNQLIGNENLVAGQKTVSHSLVALLVDQGQNPPGHRETLLAPEWNYVACYNFGEVDGYPNNWVQNFGR